MIVAFSTSSAVASVAVQLPGGEIVERSQEAPRTASAACLAMLDELLAGADTREVEEWIADIGPGSFIGVRVGVMLAKTFAFAGGRLVRGLSAFDLIDADRTVAFPSRRGEWFVRVPGEPAYRTTEVPVSAVGFGLGGEDRFPSAARAIELRSRASLVNPEELRPDHLMEPAISQPKTPYRRVDR
ncbi:MAG: tRNA (adenosine(37)-N6)-threonylcarbamoyltransferase complex dimerization subunit type 1 TsaB [Methanoregulaceae archaeon]|nr:tRNA (adenosine(37)-N6)-threonylcarbamoyltransferase complex dimerization subunit type 1 TsaB [Methanoregulaceae archaeon]